MLSPNVFPSSVQQLLAAIQPQVFSQQQQHAIHQQQLQQAQLHQQQQKQHHQQQQQLQLHQQSQRSMSPLSQHHLPNSTVQRQASPISTHTRVQTPKQSPSRCSSTLSSHIAAHYGKQSVPTSTAVSQSQTHQMQGHFSHAVNGQLPSTPHHLSVTRSHSPSSAVMNSISR